MEIVEYNGLPDLNVELDHGQANQNNEWYESQELQKPKGNQERVGYRVEVVMVISIEKIEDKCFEVLVVTQ